MSEAILAAFSTVARPLILKFFPPNSCIASTRIALECLRRFGFTGEGLSVEFVCEFAERGTAYVGGLRPESEREARRTAKSFTRLKDPSGEGADMHVVAVVSAPGGRWLIDASFDQVGAGRWPVPPEPLIVPIPANLDRLEIHLDARIELADGVRAKVQYRSRPERDFEGTPAWELDHITPLISLICRCMEEVLALGAKGRPCQ